MRIKVKTLLIAIAIPLLVGGASALLTMGDMEAFGMLNQPPLSPPAWLFPVAWTVLYCLMGVASYLVFESTASLQTVASALFPYLVQLLLNFAWPLFFFKLGAYWFSLVWLAALLALVVLVLVRFYRINKLAGLLILPYVLWLVFAAYLNAGVAYLN